MKGRKEDFVPLSGDRKKSNMADDRDVTEVGGQGSYDVTTLNDADWFPRKSCLHMVKHLSPLYLISLKNTEKAKQ